MPTTYTSPYATAFKSALKRRTSYNVAVNNIAKRNNCTPDKVWASLHKAGLCCRQKFNGQWVYFPWDVTKCNATTQKVSQTNSWQWFCEWCLTSGFCTPDKMYKHCGSQKEFMTFCRKFFGKQFNWTAPAKSSSRKSTTRKTTTRKSYNKTSKNYSFPGATARKAA